MVTLLEAVFLGLVQGLTEWLPISSSGHLVIIQQLFNIKVTVFFDVALHFGTLLAVFALFWKDIVKILRVIVGLNFSSPEGRLTVLLILASISSAPIALLLYSLIDFFFSSLFVTGLALLVTGGLIYLTKFTTGRKKIGKLDSVLIGIAQSVSIIPGMSRSGLTISTGLLRKIDRKIIFEFSFLLVIPALISANLLELANVVVNEIHVDILETTIGTLIAAIVGYISLKFLFQILQKKKFYLFSYYCWFIGILVLLYLFLI